MRSRRVNAILLIFAALSAMALIIHDLHARSHGKASYAAAQAIAGGYEDREQVLDSMARKPLRVLPDDPVAADDQVRANELDAGAVWAKVHHVKAVSDCPTNSRMFYAGCAAVMRGEWPSDPE